MKITKALISKILKNPKDVLGAMSDDDIAQVLQHANMKYYNKEPAMADDAYDMIKEFLEKRAPKHPFLKTVGAQIPVSDKRKVRLPYYMGSMDKIKSEGSALSSFSKDFPGDYVISDKLDGNSALLYKDISGNMKLFSRGDGKVGQDISYIIPLIRGIPDVKTISGEASFAIRGELIISKQDFDKVSDKGANARNMVAGLVNAKLPDISLLQNVQFVAYTLIHPNLKPSMQHQLLKQNGFCVVHSSIIKHNDLNFDRLSNVLIDRKQSSPYEIDGIIVTHDNVHALEDGKNPSYAFAFKNIITQDIAEVVVTNVEWNVSKDGYIKPVVEFNPVQLGGVMIKRATGFNAGYIKENVIGPGSKIMITRSGDVIPYITKVLTSAASGEPMFPDMSFTWIDSGKDIVVSGQNTELDFKQLEHFFDKLKVAGLSTGTIRKLYDNGLDSITKIINASVPDVAKMPGLGEKSAQKIVDGIKDAIKNVDCIILMEASNAFGRGFGEKKLRAICTSIPNIINTNYIPSKQELLNVEGVSDITASKFIEGLKQYREFNKNIKINCNNSIKTVKATTQVKQLNKNAQLFKDTVAVITGFRDQNLEEFINDNGGKVVSGFSSKVTLVIAKDLTKESSKVKDAKAKGVTVVTLAEFKQKYNFP